MEDFSETLAGSPAGTERLEETSGLDCEKEEGRCVRDVRDVRETGEEKIQTCVRWAGSQMLKVVPAVCSSAVPSLGWPWPRRK